MTVLLGRCVPLRDAHSSKLKANTSSALDYYGCIYIPIHFMDKIYNFVCYSDMLRSIWLSNFHHVLVCVPVSSCFPFKAKIE